MTLSDVPIPVPKAQPWMHVVAPVWSAPMGEGALQHVLQETKFAQDGNVHHLPLSCSVVVWLYWGIFRVGGSVGDPITAIFVFLSPHDVPDPRMY